jgi:hypothetical protein
MKMQTYFAQLLHRFARKLFLIANNVSGRGKLLLCVGGVHGNVSVWLLPDAHEEGWHQSAPKLAFELLDNSYYYPVTTMSIRGDGAMLSTGKRMLLKTRNRKSLTKIPCYIGCSRGLNGVVNVWSLQDGSLLQTCTGFGGVQSLCWLGSIALAICFARTKVN